MGISLAGNSDNDLLPNDLERLLGTNPLDGNSSFDMHLSRGEQGMQIHYGPHSDSCLFVVESTIELSNPESWQVVEGVVFSGHEYEQVADLPDTGERAAFYRISVNVIE